MGQWEKRRREWLDLRSVLEVEPIDVVGEERGKTVGWLVGLAYPTGWLDGGASYWDGKETCFRREHEKFWFKSLFEKHSPEPKYACFKLYKITRWLWLYFGKGNKVDVYPVSFVCQVLSHLLNDRCDKAITIVFWNKWYYLWFPDEETEAQSGGWLTQITQLGRWHTGSAKPSPSIPSSKLLSPCSSSVTFVTELLQYDHRKSMFGEIRLALVQLFSCFQVRLLI